MLSKDKTAVLVAEFLGTFILASAVLGMITKIGIPFFGAVTAGATLGLMVLIIGKISGAHVNPAVTFGLWSVRKVPTTKAIAYIAAQLLGGLCAWRLGVYFFAQQLPVMASSNLDWRVFSAETVGAFVFTFGIAAALAQKLEDGKLAGAIGISLFCGIVIASMASNGVVNPAVAVGIRSVNASYVLGPLVGAVIGFNLYEYMFTSSPKKTKKAKTTKKSKKK